VSIDEAKGGVKLLGGGYLCAQMKTRPPEKALTMNAQVEVSLVNSACFPPAVHNFFARRAGISH
jgi:hypothetical protein